MLALKGFRQIDENTIELELDGEVGSPLLATTHSVPNSIDHLDGLKPTHVNGSRIRIGLNELYQRTVYSIFIVWPKTSHGRDIASSNYVEIVRQPALWLKERFGFDRAGGYSILGRRSIDVATRPMPQRDDPVFVGIPKLDLGEPPAFTSYPEVNRAAQIIRSLWASEARTGPIARSYDEFLKLSFTEKLDAIRRGEFAVMCQGIRDLFLHAALGVPNFKVRAVDAYDYAEPFTDLITYSHTTAEVWVEILQRWIVIDPWIGFFLEDPTGLPMSADKIATTYGIKVVPFIDGVPRYRVGSDGALVRTVEYASSISMDSFSTTDSVTEPSYRTYFNQLMYRYPRPALDEG